MDRLLDLLNLLREARPEIVGGLVVAAVLALVGFLLNRLRSRPGRKPIEITLIEITVFAPAKFEFKPPSAATVETLRIPHPSRRPERRLREIGELLQLLRESLPEIIGGLAVAALLALVGVLYSWWGVVGGVIAVGVVSTILLLFLRLYELYTGIQKAPIPPTPTFRPPPEPSRPIPRPPLRPEPRFIPRHDLVERVSEALSANGLVTIWGTAGVGKTTLAVEVANHLSPLPYSGGVIWETADARPHFTLVTLLDKILTDLGHEEARTLVPRAKANLAERLLTEAMPCLLVLDSFDTIAEGEQTAIIAFLNDLSCPVLVTSRKSLPPGRNIHLESMTPAEAQQFLKMRIEYSVRAERLKGVNWGQVAEVAEYNPVLMRWVVAQLEQAMRPQDVFDEVARGKGEVPERIFDQYFERLGDDGQMVLLALALFVPTASREALAAVCGFEDGKDRVNEAIRTLASFDLLDTAAEGDRLGIVALTRRLTETQLNKDKRAQGLKERFVAHFLAYAQAHPEVTKEDLDALDDERENLLATLDYAYAAEDWESVMRLADEICSPAAGLLGIRGYWDEATKWGERAAEAARQANLPAVAAAFSVNVGSIRLQRGDYAQAREAYQKALPLFQQASDERNVAVALYQLGIIAQLQGDYQKAEELYNQGLEIASTLGDRTGISYSLHQLGMLAHDQGNYQEAKDLYNQSLEIDKQLGNQAGIAKSLHQLGRIAQDQGNYQEAKDLYDQSLEIKRNLGDQAGIATSLHQLGIIAQLQGHYQETKDLYDQSLEIKRNLGDQAGIATSLHQLGRVAEETSNKGEAAQFYREALAIFERLGVPEAEIARRSLARVSKEKE